MASVPVLKDEFDEYLKNADLQNKTLVNDLANLRVTVAEMSSSTISEIMAKLTVLEGQHKVEEKLVAELQEAQQRQTSAIEVLVMSPGGPSEMAELRSRLEAVNEENREHREARVKEAADQHQKLKASFDELGAKLKTDFERVESRMGVQEALAVKIESEMDALKLLEQSVKVLGGRASGDGDKDDEREARKNVVDRKGFKDKLKPYSGDLGEREYRTMSFDLKRLVKKDRNFPEFITWLEELNEEMTFDVLDAKRTSAGWNTEWLNEQLYGVLAEIATGSLKEKVMSTVQLTMYNGAKLLRDLAREHVGASKAGTAALGRRITKPAQSEMKDFEQRLLDWDMDAATYTRITGEKLLELRVEYLKDMMPGEVADRYETEKHRINSYEELWTFFSRIIADWKNDPRSVSRKPGRLLKELETEMPREHAEEPSEDPENNLWTQLMSFIRTKGGKGGKGNWGKGFENGKGAGAPGGGTSSASTKPADGSPAGAPGTFDGLCHWCKQPGHRMNQCELYTKHKQEQGKGVGFGGGKGGGFGGGKGSWGKGSWGQGRKGGKGAYGFEEAAYSFIDAPAAAGAASATWGGRLCNVLTMDTRLGPDPDFPLLFEADTFVEVKEGKGLPAGPSIVMMPGYESPNPFVQLRAEESVDDEVDTCDEHETSVLELVNGVDQLEAKPEELEVIGDDCEVAMPSVEASADAREVSSRRAYATTVREVPACPAEFVRAREARVKSRASLRFLESVSRCVDPACVCVCWWGNLRWEPGPTTGGDGSE